MLALCHLTQDDMTCLPRCRPCRHQCLLSSATSCRIQRRGLRARVFGRVPRCARCARSGSRPRSRRPPHTAQTHEQRYSNSVHLCYPSIQERVLYTEYASIQYCWTVFYSSTVQCTVYKFKIQYSTTRKICVLYWMSSSRIRFGVLFFFYCFLQVTKKKLCLLAKRFLTRNSLKRNLMQPLKSSYAFWLLLQYEYACSILYFQFYSVNFTIQVYN